MALTGLLHFVGEIDIVSEKFKKRNFVIEVPNERNNDWNDFILVQLAQDKVTAIDGLSLGSEIKCQINIRGRKHLKDGKTNYYNTVEAWKVEVLSAGF